MKRLIISWIITPKRARAIIARIVSWLLYRCVISGTWSVVSAFSAYLRRIADLVDAWNAVELPADKDKLIADLIKDAVTDEAIDWLIDKVAALSHNQQPRLIGESHDN